MRRAIQQTCCRIYTRVQDQQAAERRHRQVPRAMGAGRLLADIQRQLLRTSSPVIQAAVMTVTNCVALQCDVLLKIILEKHMRARRSKRASQTTKI